MSCSSSNASFPTASSMAQLATNYPIIWDEISGIQQAIMAAVSQCTVGGGQLSTIVAGSTPMTYVSGVSSVTVVSPGTGYVQDIPAVVFVPPLGSSASGATGTVTTNGGAILSINVTAGGTGYQPIPATLAVTSTTGTGASLVPLVSATGQIVSVNIITGGTGYTIGDSVIATRAVAYDSAYVNATFQIAAVSITGQIISVNVVTQGSGYQSSVATASIVSNLNPLMPYPLGAGFSGTVFVNSSGVITQVAVNNTGAGYANFLPYLTISSVGTGATTQTTLSGSGIGSISVINQGTGYTSAATGIVYNPPTASAPNPPASPASVTINIPPNTFNTTPSLYYQVWAGLATNAVIQSQLNAVISYFTGLGYNISIQSNPTSTNTIQWYISWSS